MNKSFPQWILPLCGVAVLGVYLMTLSQHVLGGDNAEFLSLYAQGGVAHPSGYPLYVLLLRLFSAIVPLSPVFGAGVVTAGLGTAAFLASYHAARTWGTPTPGSLIAAMLIAFSPLMWILSTHAEVFALHAFLGASIVALAGPHNRLPTGWRAVLVGAAAGAGLANNLSLVTLTPLGLLAAWQVLYPRKGRLRHLGLGLGGLALGLSPYLWLYRVGRAGQAELIWGRFDSLSDLLHHAIRGDYGSTQLAIVDGPSETLGHLLLLGYNLLTNLHFAGLLVVLIGLATLFSGAAPPATPAGMPEQAPAGQVPLHQQAAHPTQKTPSIAAAGQKSTLPVPRLHALVFVATWLVAGPLFVSLFNLASTGLARTVVTRFHLLPLVLLVVPLARGICRIAPVRLGRSDILAPTIAALSCSAIFISYDQVREHHRPDVEYYLYNTVRAVPNNAIILGTGDHRLFGFHYLRHVVGERPDVIYVDVTMLHYPWYREKIEGDLGFELRGIESGTIHTLDLALGLLAQRRELYLANTFSDAIPARLPTYPIGTLIRVLPPDRRPPPPDELEAINAAAASRFLYARTAPRDPNGWAANVLADHTRPWHVIASAYQAMGRHEDAARVRARSIVLPKETP